MNKKKQSRNLVFDKPSDRQTGVRELEAMTKQVSIKKGPQKN